MYTNYWYSYLNYGLRFPVIPELSLNILPQLESHSGSKRRTPNTHCYRRYPPFTPTIPPPRDNRVTLLAESRNEIVIVIPRKKDSTLHSLPSVNKTNQGLYILGLVRPSPSKYSTLKMFTQKTNIDRSKGPKITPMKPNKESPMTTPKIVING